MRPHPEDDQGLTPEDGERPVGVPGPEVAERDREDVALPVGRGDRCPDIPGGREERTLDELDQEG